MLLCSTQLGSFLTEMSNFSQLQPNLLLLCFTGVNGKLLQKCCSLWCRVATSALLLKGVFPAEVTKASLLQSTTVSDRSSERSSPKTHSRNLFARGESRRGTAAERAEMARCQLNMYRTYIGLLTGRVFPGRRFSGWVGIA